MFQSIKEGFTPQDVEGIIQPPGSYTIGSVDPGHLKDNKMLTVSNGYTKDVIDNLRPSDPEPFDKETTNSLGDFPEAEQELLNLNIQIITNLRWSTNAEKRLRVCFQTVVLILPTLLGPPTHIKD